MKKLKQTLFGIFTFAAAFCAGGAAMAADEAVICPEKGEPATIILPAKCSRSVEHAANELQLILGKITGKQFKISEKPVPGTKIFLDKAPDHLRLKMSPGNSFAISSKGDLYLGGEGKNGTLHAVYHFLQDELQYRVLSPFGDEFIPQKKEIKVALNKTYTNGLDYRCLMTYIYHRDRKPTFEFYIRNFQNWEVRSNHLSFLNQFTPIGKDHHSIFKFMPPDKYFKDHPEFYTMDKTGKRVKNKQMCFSSKEMRKIFLENVKAHAATRYQKAIEEYGDCYIELSAMDYGGKFCHCPECAKKEQQYGTPCGAFFEFLAEISAGVQKDFPKLKIATLGYRKEQTEIPPNGLIFPDNFVIIFAPIDDNVLAPLDHVSNQETMGHLKKWCQISKNILVWYYPNPYESYLGPYSALRRACRDVEIMKKLGITGTIYEHDVTARTNSNFADLESWVLLRMFSGYENSEALIMEYMNLAYGKAAALMYLYFDELERRREAAVRNGYAGNFIVGPEEMKYMTPENLERWNTLFDIAEKFVADDAAALFRMRRVRYELDLMILRRFHDFAKDSGIRLAGADVVSKRVTDTLQKMKAAKMNVKDFDVQIREVQILTDLANSTGKTKYLDADAEDVRIVFFPSGAEDKDAITGIAKAHGGVTFPYGIYAHDYIMETIGKKIKAKWTFLQKAEIETKDILPDKYKYYRLGEVKLSAATRLSLTSNSYFFRNAGLFAYPEKPGTVWEVWFSMKFEGPAVPGSKAKVNKAYCDHFLLIRKKARAEKLPAELEKLPADKIITAYPVLSGFNKKNTVEDSKASRGKAVFEDFSAGSLFFNTYDNKTKANKRHLTLQPAKLNAPDGYKFYKFPAPVKLTKSTLICGNLWLVNVNVGAAIPKDDSYIVYLSLRFDNDAKKAYCDKVLLVPESALK